MNDNNEMKVLADNLFEYMKPKITEMLSSSVRYFKAEVVSAPDTTSRTVKVKRPLDDAVLTLGYAESANTLVVGDQCLCLVFGALSNAKVIAKADLSTL